MNIEHIWTEIKLLADKCERYLNDIDDDFKELLIKGYIICKEKTYNFKSIKETYNFKSIKEEEEYFMRRDITPEEEVFYYYILCIL